MAHAVLTEQETQPHPQLVQCRLKLETTMSRRAAAAVANRMSHSEVDAILKASSQSAVTKAAADRIAEVAKARPDLFPDAVPELDTERAD